jgi:peptidoglycan/LPS O-acetylase OafA/YrhL
MRSNSERYDLLDGLRGLAAIGVMLSHFDHLDAPVIMPHAYLAVDFFFILSGFVIAHAYTARLGDMPWRRFAVIRAQRFLPLSMLGVAIGALYLVLRWLMRPDLSDSLGQILGAANLSLLLIPKFWVGHASQDILFPADGALWTLSLELAVNLAWAGLFVRARTAAMLIVAVVGAVLLTACARAAGDADIGWGLHNYMGGVGRALFGFFLGVVLWRLRPAKPTPRAMAWLAAAALMLILCGPGRLWTFDVAAILVAFPLIIYFAANPEAGRGNGLLRTLGEVSYPLYALHMPFLMVTAGVLHAASLNGRIGYWAYAAAIPMIGVALLMGRFYDAPVRRWLSGLSLSSRRQTARPA